MRPMGSWSADVGAGGAEAHSLFEVYDEYLVPLVFQAYAEDMLARVVGVAGMASGSLLEIAAGTGVVTRLLAAALPPEVAITATDLVPGMLERAERVGTTRPVTWEVADALALPYADESFDTVVCAFGAMFFHPHPAAFAEMRRVLRPGGRVLVSVWDRLEANDFASAVDGALREACPDDPPEFLRRTPYSYSDPEVIVADLLAAGFTATPLVETIPHRSRADAPLDVALAVCAGTPVRDEIQRHGPGSLARAIEATAVVLGERFGATDLDGAVSAIFVTVAR
jgi:SAM-dependent methyltransferase